MRISLNIFLAFILAGVSHIAVALNCNDVRQLTALFFKMHYSVHKFDDQLSTRTMDNFIKSWDPSKVYFLQGDIEKFEAAYGKKADDQINKNDCSAIDAVVNTYAQRFNEAQNIVFKLINDKHDFSTEEYLEIERKNMPYAKTTEEITERWRKRVKFQLLQLKQTLKDYEKAKQKLAKRYQLATKRQSEVTTDNVYSAFLNAFSSALDPHSEYLSTDKLEDFRIQTKLSLEGIGAVLRGEDGFTTIQSLVPGGSAFKSGKLKVDDKIIAVGQGAEATVDVIDMDLRDVVKLIRGTRGTEVRLTIMREQADKPVQFIVPLLREQIQLTDKAAKSKVIEVSVNETSKDGKDNKEIKPTKYRIGVLTLPSFYMDFEGRQAQEENFRSSSRDTLKEILALNAQNIDAMIVDLRGNGGGSLDESINVAGLFIDKGPVVQIKRTEGGVEVQADKDPRVFYEGPLSVLINRQSASASEIFAGAIQDYNRGLIIGDKHTFGKGTVQNMNDISERHGAIKVTISKFYRPSGSSTQLKGVESDIVLPDLVDEYEIGEKYYDYAMEWDKIKKAEFKQTNQSQEFVSSLKDLSAKRVTKDPGFQKINEEIKKFRENEVERSRVSLQEKDPSKDKDAKDDKTAEEDEVSNEDVKLVDDMHMQETLRIMGDYLHLIKKKSPGVVLIPEVVKALAETKTDAKGKKSPDGAKKSEKSSN